MANIDIYSIAMEVNKRAKGHLIGDLQKIRKDIKKLRRLPGKEIFDAKTIAEDRAFHVGARGRTELQFNLAIENRDGGKELRHGVAFCLETSRSMRSINDFIPKIVLFNEFIQLYIEKYSDMRMWHYYKKANRSTDTQASPIPPELFREDAFIFLGKRQPLSDLDYDLILNDFDRLLPLYKYVESSERLQPISTVESAPFEFRSGCTEKQLSTETTLAQRELDIRLRHNELQKALYLRLAEKYGASNVGTELQSGVGTSVDLVVRCEGEYWFYEIKTALSPRACLRQALGQLLEYAFWPGAQEATHLVVVGEFPLDNEGAKYLNTLRERFSLPLDYEQISLSP